MTVDLEKLAFYSGNNYMKKGFSGSQDLTLGGSNSVVTHTVTHNLGYIPDVYIGAELEDNSVIWASRRVYSGLNASIGSDYPLSVQYWVDTTTLTIRLQNGVGSLVQSGNRTVYWGIYYDYST